MADVQLDTWESDRCTARLRATRDYLDVISNTLLREEASAADIATWRITLPTAGRLASETMAARPSVIQAADYQWILRRLQSIYVALDRQEGRL